MELSKMAMILRRYRTIRLNKVQITSDIEKSSLFDRCWNMCGLTDGSGYCIRKKGSHKGGWTHIRCRRVSISNGNNFLIAAPKSTSPRATWRKEAIQMSALCMAVSRIHLACVWGKSFDDALLRRVQARSAATSSFWHSRSRADIEETRRISFGRNQVEMDAYIYSGTRSWVREWNRDPCTTPFIDRE